MVLLVDNYDSFTYNLYQYVEQLGWDCCVVRNDKIKIEEIQSAAPSHILISPGPGRPENAGQTNNIIQFFADQIPLLGICLGHQAIGQVFGGAVISAPLLMHGKVSEIQHDEKTIFTGLPNPLKVMRYHSLTVEAHTLPRELEISSHSPDGTIMSLRHRSYAVEGVQFHPESFACEGGLEIIHNFLKGVGH